MDGFPNNLGRERHCETAVFHCGKIIHVEWVGYEDIKEPEWKPFLEKTIVSVTPPEYLKLLGEGYLLELCEIEEKRKNG